MKPRVYYLSKFKFLDLFKRNESRGKNMFLSPDVIIQPAQPVWCAKCA